ncbi:MAG: ribose-5-phosphate isomerase RpiA [Candidatus Bathyarchaeota archaeon]
MSLVNEAKKRAAIASTKLIKNGQVIGIGSGSTVHYMIEELGRRIRDEKLSVLGISTSNKTTELAKKHGIPLTFLDEHPQLDIAIDGADQVDSQLNLIKGLGGALTREKIIDGVAENLVIIVDEGKMTTQLGINQVVPVEVIPFALPPVMKKLLKLGGKPSIRLTTDNHNRFITDNLNNIVDVDFGAIKNPKKLESEIKQITGVVENGLFINMAKIVLIGNENNIKKIERKE